MQVLDLSCNNLSSTIWDSQFQNSCKNLVWIDLSMNHLTGPIPGPLCNCTNLNYLNQSYNSLVGEVPGAISELRNFAESRPL